MNHMEKYLCNIKNKYINKQRYTDLWNNIKHSYICIITFSKTEEKVRAAEKYLKNGLFFFFNLMKKVKPKPEEACLIESKQVQHKENYLKAQCNHIDESQFQRKILKVAMEKDTLV